jgi:hypothetical protein
MATNGKQYVVGKGQIYFDPFVPGTFTKTGEDYMGNTPEFSTAQDQSTLDHYDSDAGLNVKDESVVIEQNVTGTLVTDNISVENVARWFGGDVDNVTVAAATAIVETHDVTLGRYVQLGATTSSPSGARKITNLVVKVGATTILQPGNYEADLDRARVYIEPDSTDIADGDTVEFTYDQAATTRTTIIGKGSPVAGSLRFISRNPIGPQKDYYFPYVKLTPNGDYALKGDEWQQIPFSFEVLKKDAATERVYIDGVPA